MITVSKFSEELSEDWDNFVENEARNSTFLHTRKFFRHNPLNGEFDSSLIFRKKSKIIGVIPAVLRKIDGLSVWHSHAFATYGGFVVSGKFGVADAVESVELLIEFAKENGIDRLIIRNPFRIFSETPTDETDYAMWFHGFEILRRDVEIVISLQKATRENLKSFYDSSTKRAVKAAEKSGVKIETTHDFSGYWQILTQNLAERHDAKPTHTLEQFQVLRESVGDDKIKLFGAYLDEKLIAGIVLFITSRHTLHAQYIAGLNEFQNLRPMNLVIDQICRWALENNFRFFNLGMSTNPDESGINEGLSRFKEGFGGRSVLRETMQLKLNE